MALRHLADVVSTEFTHLDHLRPRDHDVAVQLLGDREPDGGRGQLLPAGRRRHRHGERAPGRVDLGGEGERHASSLARGRLALYSVRGVGVVA